MTIEQPTIGERVKQKLLTELPAEHVEVIDESHLHAGHAGARGGAAHLRVLVVARVFAGKAPLTRHRMVNAVLANELQQEIHALTIETKTAN